MNYSQALDGLTKSLAVGVSHQIWMVGCSEITQVIGMLQEKTPQKYDKPMLFFFKFSGVLHLWMVENYKNYTSGPKIIEKFKEGYGKSWKFHLDQSLALLAGQAQGNAHSLYLKDFGAPAPLALMKRGLPEPSYN